MSGAERYEDQECEVAGLGSTREPGARVRAIKLGHYGAVHCRPVTGEMTMSPIASGSFV